VVRTLGLAAPSAPRDVTASYPPHRPHAPLVWRRGNSCARAAPRAGRFAGLQLCGTPV